MKLEAGDRFTTEIDFITRRGIGSVSSGHDTITVGPVTCNEGEEVQLKYLGEREAMGNTMSKYAICLTDSVLADGYMDYIRDVVEELLPDEPPSVGEITYAEIDEVSDRNLAYTILGGTRISLGPVRAAEGDLVKVEGYTYQSAKVLKESDQGDNYETRLQILTERFDRLPISIGDEVTTAINGVDDGVHVGYVGEIPIHFPNGGAELAQKVDAKIERFEKDRVIAKVIKTYDEVGRPEESSHWARMQLLRQEGFSENPLREFASEFIGVDAAVLPENEDRLREVIIAEGMRIGLTEKVRDNDGEYPRAHVSGFRHWVVHKLAAVLGKPDDENNWFREILLDRQGPTMTFLGDILQLGEGYYARAPDRVVMSGPNEGVLISSRPSSDFLDHGFHIEFRGISRILPDIDATTLEKQGITVQPREQYISDGDLEHFDKAYLKDFIRCREARDRAPNADWLGYTGHHGYGFDWDEEPSYVTLDDETTLSMWKVPVEYGTDEYHLSVEGPTGDTELIKIPSRYQKHLCLQLDQLSGPGREAHFEAVDDDAVISCDFAPPRAQIRWLHAIGAEWLTPRNNRIQWQFPTAEIESVKDVFGKLPIAIVDNTNGASN
jgi:hypothetical protein